MLKKRKSMMDKETKLKIHTMMSSKQEDMAKLGFSLAKGAIKTYQDYRELRGTSIAGKPFFPFSLKQMTKKLGKELRIANSPKLLKRSKREKTYLNG